MAGLNPLGYIPVISEDYKDLHALKSCFYRSFITLLDAAFPYGSAGALKTRGPRHCFYLQTAIGRFTG